MEAVPAPVSPRVIPAYLFHQANEVFSDCSLVCWFFLVMSTSCMWHVVPWGNRARRLAPTARQTKCVCLCSSVSLRCVHRQLSEKDSMIAALWLPSCISFYLFPFGSKTLNNLRGVWLLILLSIRDKTGELLLLLVVSHTVTKVTFKKGAGRGK